MKVLVIQLRDRRIAADQGLKRRDRWIAVEGGLKFYGCGVIQVPVFLWGRIHRMSATVGRTPFEALYRFNRARRRH